MKLFDRISKTYDITNTVISFGMDKVWRDLVTSMAGKRKGVLLDIGTGTGKQLISILSTENNIRNGIGIDLSKDMIDICNKNLKNKKLQDKIIVLLSDSGFLPIKDKSIDLATISFGIRNMDIKKTLEETIRILKFGGNLLILEFSLPNNLLVRVFYLFYLRHIVPIVGWLFSRDLSAYKYLNKSIENFPYGQDFINILRVAGFKEVGEKKLFFGIATIYYGIRR
jgi:demethylmenaquinone methyltransferase / 2-methoxy-6-polyprenyl-1,4-benzoquinol methylase